MGTPERPPSFINREVAGRFSAGDIGPCAWKGICGRPGSRDYVRLIEERLGVEWPADPDVVYCPIHTDLVVERAVQLFIAQQRFLESDRMTE